MTDLTANDVLVSAQLSLPKREYRFGDIRVNSYLLERVGASIRACNTQGELQDKGVFAEVQKLLLLPESYSIWGMFLRLYDPQNWHIVVQSPDLPEVEPNNEAPEIVPIYRRDEAGNTYLVEIRIGAHWTYIYTPADANVPLGLMRKG